MTLLQKELSSVDATNPLLNNPPTNETKATDEVSVETLNNVIIEAIQDKKGHNVMLLDLREVMDASTDFFIICHGNSDTQVKAIANNISKETKEKIQQRPSHMEGITHASWVLLDYFNVVVHVFLKKTRDFYNLEGLWSDAKITEYSSL